MSVVIATMSMGAFAVVPVPMAHADCSGGEHSIFVQKQNGNNAWGIRGSMRAYNQSADCSGPIFQTVHVNFTAAHNEDWVELGLKWEGGTQPEVWASYGYFGDEVQFFYRPLDISAHPSPRFRLEHVPSSSDVDLFAPGVLPPAVLTSDPNQFTWDLWFKADETDSKWVLLDVWKDMYDTHGTAEGEVSKYHSESTAWQWEWNLDFKNSGGQNKPWGGMSCYTDGLSSWRPYHIANDEWETLNEVGDCSDFDTP